MFAKGRGVAQDDAEAVRWYRLAAAQGYAYAQFNLGNMFEKGRGVAKDTAEAIRLYRLAAAQGVAAATAALQRLGAWCACCHVTIAANQFNKLGYTGGGGVWSLGDNFPEK
jgi:TPR repeat protein